MKKIVLAALFIFTLSSSFAQWTASGANIYNSNSGNVGVGTTSPVYKLVVSNSAANGFEVDPTSASGTQTALLSFNRSTSLYSPLSFSASSFTFAQGNVGIGTSSPVYKLVVSNAAANGFEVDPTSASGTQTAISSYNRGTSSYTPLSFSASSFAFAQGNVGIGTTSPVYKLVVSNSAANGFEVDPTSASGTQTALLSFNRSTSLYSPLSFSASSFTFAQGNVGIGTTTPPTVGNYGVLALNGRSASQGGYLSLMTNGTETGAIAANTQLNINAASGIVTQFYTGSTPTLQISSGGNVLINQISQANTGYKLDVNGSIRSNAVVVNTSGADFVFNRNYHLNSLGDLEQYIEKNHHLPEIKSAEEMQKEGMNVGELNTKLLQKVEELTLYLIEKDKQLSEQQKKGEQQDRRIAALESALSKLISSDSNK